MQTQSKKDQYTSGFSVLKGLTRHLCSQLSEAEQKRLMKHVIASSSTPEFWQSLSSRALAADEEASLVLKIERHLRKLNKGDSIARFNQLDRLLKNRCKPPFFSNRVGLLSFLLLISEKQQSNTPVHCGLKLVPQEEVKNRIFRNTPSSTSLSVVGPSPPCNVHRSASAELSSRAKRPTTLQTTNPIRSSASEKSVGKQSSNRPHSSVSISNLSESPSRLVASKKGAPSEERVIKELLFCFQGIPGSIFKLDHQQGFSIDPLMKIPHEGLVVKMIELGYLHNRIMSQSKQLEKAGAVAQAILRAVEVLINDYYAMIGCMHSEFVSSSEHVCDTPMTEESSVERSPPLSIFRLLVLCREPLRMLKLIADVIKFALTSKGGAAFSAIEILRHHGDVRFSNVMSQIVDQAGKPLVHMIIVWLVHGQLFDPYDEFFIAINSSCRERDIWRDKFVLRSNLVPSVLSTYHAEMILRAGKGINFLNVIREVRLPLEGLRKKLHDMKSCNIIDFANPRSHLCEMLTGVVHETSKLVLDVLINEFKLFQHFQGLRRYILLGQGDFASYFLELIEPEMRKEASRLQFHELMSLLGTAIRGSTAAYDDPDILKGVTVKVLEASGGDWGSDVFGLQYLMHEPLDAALRVSGGAYSYMFNFLWRTKRMEYILLVLRKERWTVKNELCWMGERVPEVNNVLMFADLMTQEFLHFAREFHYYILFEVVECSWAKFCNDFKKARSFDDVIRAHEEFLYEMRRRTFQGNDDSTERTFINELRLVWDLVFELENLQKKFFERLLKEWEIRQNRETALDSGSGTSYKEEEKFKAGKKEFKTFLSYIKAQYNIIHRNYQDVLKKFLLDLSSQKDHELRLLSSRIDYNEYYKRADARLNESMKFSRCSDMFF